MRKTLSAVIAVITLLLAAPLVAQEGNALPGMQIRLVAGDGSVKTCISAKDGSWSFHDLEPGQYTIVITRDQIQESEKTVQTLLLPALMKAKEKANRSRSGVNVAAGDVTGDGIEFTLRFDKLSNVSAPRDAQSGQATGKRMHKPIRFAKEWEPVTIQITKLGKSNGSASGRISYDLALNKGI